MARKKARRRSGTATRTAGRTSTGRLRKGYTIKSGRVVKAKARRRRR